MLSMFIVVVFYVHYRRLKGFNVNLPLFVVFRDFLAFTKAWLLLL